MTIQAIHDALSYSQHVLKPICVILSGGEPTVRTDFPQIIAAIQEQHDLQVFHLHTNASQIESHRNILAAGIAKRHSATVGIHGHKAAIYESITGISGSFEKGIRGIRTLLEIGFEVRATCVICMANFTYLSEITDFLLTIGVHIVELRLPIAGPERNLTGIIVPRGLLEESVARWLEQFRSEPRTSLIAADARCFGTFDMEAGNVEYHFFDGQSKPPNERRATLQLAAIWKEAYEGYQKSPSCCHCVFDTACKGYSKEEVKAGYASYSPIDTSSILAHFR